MALNVALPLSGLPELLYERCAILSPIEPDFEDNLELLVTPYESSECSESGIGSSESKKQKPSSDDDEGTNSNSTTLSTTPSSSSPSSSSSTPENESNAKAGVEKSAELELKHDGRKIFDTSKFINAPWNFQYAKLPENNLQMFMQNRSLYHRLGADGLNCDYELAQCAQCDFHFPVMSHEHEKAQNKPSFKTYKHF